MHCLDVLGRTSDLLQGPHFMLKICRFVATRFLLAIVTLLIVTFVVYSLMELSPAQIFERCWVLVDGKYERQLLNEFYVIRWLIWVSDIFLHGDLGSSCITPTPQTITGLIGARFWISLGICISSLLLAYLIAIPVGIYSVVSPNIRLNHLVRFFFLPGSCDSEFSGRDYCSSGVVKFFRGNAHGAVQPRISSRGLVFSQVC